MCYATLPGGFTRGELPPERDIPAKTACKEQTMIRNKAHIPHETREHLFGGKGSLDCIPLLTGDEFHGKGRTFSVNTLKPGHSVGVHAHKGDFEVYYILQGEGIYNDNGVEERIKAGDVAYAWDGQSHGILNDGVEDMEMIALVLFTDK